MIDGKNISDQPVKNNPQNSIQKIDSIHKIAIGQGDGYTTACLLDYIYFKSYYKMIATDLSKQRAWDADAKSTEQTNFNGNLTQEATIFFIIEEVKEAVLDFSQGAVKVFYFHFVTTSTWHFKQKIVYLTDSTWQIKITNKIWYRSNFETFIKCGWWF